MFDYLLFFWSKISNIKGGSYNIRIKEFLGNIISSIYKAKYIKQKTLNFVDFSKLGGIYFRS